MVGIDFVTAYGREQDIKKMVLKSNGIIEEYKSLENIDALIKSIEEKEGCKLVGTIYPHLISPMVKILYSTPSPDIFLMLTSEVPEFSFNMSHTVNQQIGRAHV